MRPSSSRVYNKTCTMLSNHYDNPKVCENNADLLCKRSRVRYFDRPNRPPNAVSWSEEACVQRCLIQSCFGNIRPSSSRVYNKTCTILSNHYDSPKTREKNADLLCKRSSLRHFDRPPFLLWFGCVLNWLFTCIICAAYKPVRSICG